MLTYVNPYSSGYKINDYRFLADRLDSMESSYASGDIELANSYRDEMAQEIIGIYSDNNAEISLEEAYSLVDYQYTYMSEGITVQGSELMANNHNDIKAIKEDDSIVGFQKIGASMNAVLDNTTEATKDAKDNQSISNGYTSLSGPAYQNAYSSIGSSNKPTYQNAYSSIGSSNAPTYQNTYSLTSSINSPSYNNPGSSGYRITDFTFMAEDLEEMHEEYMEADRENDIEDAEEIEDKLVQQIIDTYEENGAEISRKEARALVNQQYSTMYGVSISDAETYAQQLVEQEEAIREAEEYREEHPVMAFFGLC